MQFKPKPKVKTDQVRKDPVDGDWRTRRTFALWPKKMEDGTWVWLERYVQTEIYRVQEKVGPIENDWPKTYLKGWVVKRRDAITKRWTHPLQ